MTTITLFFQRCVFAMSNDVKVKEQFCRLLNGLSSLRSGRDYLQSSSALVHNLCVFLVSIHDDDLLLRNALGTVQKLSLRYMSNDVICCYGYCC